MSVCFLTLYVLVWLVVVAGTLYVICRAFFKEWAQARREGRPLI